MQALLEPEAAALGYRHSEISLAKLKFHCLGAYVSMSIGAIGAAAEHAVSGCKILGSLQPTQFNLVLDVETMADAVIDLIKYFTTQMEKHFHHMSKLVGRDKHASILQYRKECEKVSGAIEHIFLCC